jgi:DNA processing protein
MAAGIDTAAHTASLDEGGRTVAVIGTGIDRVFPPENRALRDRIIASGGAIISQFFPDQPPAQWSFPMRNIVMSGLALATLVIEASETSGAKKQARAALEHGRPVFLPKELVATHEWAQRMVTKGEHGVRAVQVESIDEVVDRLTGTPKLDEAIAV